VAMPSLVDDFFRKKTLSPLFIKINEVMSGRVIDQRGPNQKSNMGMLSEDHMAFVPSPIDLS
jgi:hypothetical protein